MSRLKFPPAVTDGRIIIVLTDGKRDRVYERTANMPLGQWGEVELPKPRARNPRKP